MSESVILVTATISRRFYPTNRDHGALVNRCSCHRDEWKVLVTNDSDLPFHFSI